MKVNITVLKDGKARTIALKATISPYKYERNDASDNIHFSTYSTHCISYNVSHETTPYLRKTVQNCFAVRQISTNFDNFWQKDGKEAKIMRGALIFHLT